MISSNSQGTRLSVSPPGITLTQLAVKGDVTPNEALPHIGRHTTA